MPAVGFHARRDAAHRDVARWTEEETRRFWLSEGNDTETVRVLHALCSSSGRQDATAKADGRCMQQLLTDPDGPPRLRVLGRDHRR